MKQKTLPVCFRLDDALVRMLCGTSVEPEGLNAISLVPDRYTLPSWDREARR